MIKTRRCKVSFCDLELHSKDYCNLHYKRFQRHGGPLATSGGTDRVNEMVRLHQEEDFSTAEIAKRLGVKKNTVIASLRHRGKLRPALGRDIEERVAQWYEARGARVVRQRGDAPFDFLIEKDRIDVKSSRKGKVSETFTFELLHKGSKKKLSYIDKLLLVFIDNEKNPMFLLTTQGIPERSLLRMKDPKLSKLPLQFIGNLEEKGKGE